MTVRSLAACPCVWSAAANFAALLHVHRSSDIGSPRVTGSTRVSRAGTRCGSRVPSGLRPPPGRRHRSGGVGEPVAGTGSARSCMPARTVARDRPVASATWLMPPRPRARASTAAQRRRARSSKSGWRIANFAAIACVIGCCIASIITR